MRFSLLVLFLLATRVTAQVPLPDLRVQNAGGTMVEIHDVKLLRVDPDGIRVLHSAGSAKVPYELLPDDLQSRFGFNAEKAQQHRDNVTSTNLVAAAAAIVVQTQTQTQTQAQAATQPSNQSTTVTAPRSTGSYSYTASPRRTSLGYVLPSTRNYTVSSRRYNYCPSCTCGSSYSYSPVYYYPVSSCGTPSTSTSVSISVGR